MQKLRADRYAKCLVGATITGLTALQAAFDGGGVTAEEIVGALIATFAALGAIWAVPNTQPPPNRGN